MKEPLIFEASFDVCYLLRFQAAMDGHLKHLRSWMLVPGKETTSSGVCFIEADVRPRHDGSP